MLIVDCRFFFFFSSRRRHTRLQGDWSSDVCSSDLPVGEVHVARRIVELRAPIGGEGNGGGMYPALHVGGDAPVAAALVLALPAPTGRRGGGGGAAAPRPPIVEGKLATRPPDAARGPGGGYPAL